VPPLRPALFAALLALALTPQAWGQARPDTLRLIVEGGVARVDTTDGRLRALAPVVVTATRSARALEDVPVPTTVLPAEAIREQGALRLADLLAEQPGLVVVEGLGGSGLQLQGFDADYTLVLLDGEPVVGRTAGTLDLDRLAVTGVDRVEVVRGPLSSRFGADALAGVVNLIPRRPGETTGGRAALRVESLGVTDLSAEAETGRESWGVRLFLNRYGSEGFTFEPGSQTLALPAYSDYAAELRARYAPAEGTDLDLYARLAAQDQEGAALFAGILYDEEASRTDWSVRPTLRHRFSPRLRAEASGYASSFRNEWFAVTRETGEVFEDAEFTHTYRKAEAGLTWLPRGRAVLHAGAGAIQERIDGERYASGQASQQPYAYAEAEWTPHPRVDLVASARYDAPSDYAARLTPRLAALARPAPWLRVRASVGSGYRAPDFRQRYLAFTNPAGGYALYGAEEARERIAALEAAGGIDTYLLDPSRLGPLSAESSTALGFGLEADLPGGLSLRVNGFHNEVRDLIDTQAVALRTNGQQIFTYFNLDRIYTRGVEADATWGAALPPGLGAVRVQAGYQLLDTADRDVLDAIAAGTLFRRTPEGRDVRVTRADYGGLFGRSRHSGTLRVAHRHERLGLATTARVILRSRYGFADRNSSGVLDEGREYAPGYALLNLTTTKTLGRFDVQAGARNLLGHTDPVHLPAQPGRVVFAGASVRF
jgi:outer membrane receptor for ferrienterochelin and colicins